MDTSGLHDALLTWTSRPGLSSLGKVPGPPPKHRWPPRRPRVDTATALTRHHTLTWAQRPDSIKAPARRPAPRRPLSNNKNPSPRRPFPAPLRAPPKRVPSSQLATPVAHQGCNSLLAPSPVAHQGCGPPSAPTPDAHQGRKGICPHAGRSPRMRLASCPLAGRSPRTRPAIFPDPCKLAALFYRSPRTRPDMRLLPLNKLLVVVPFAQSPGHGLLL